MLNLTINIDPNSGFCFGVVYAVELAEEVLDQRGYLYCLGNIVHNEEEVMRLEKKGLRIIRHDDLHKLKNEKILIRAHGEPPSTYKIAAENNLELIDASCPVILKLQNRVKKAYDRKENLYIFGQHRHPEVVGLLGQTRNQATVFQQLDELDIDSLPSEITLFSQSTKSLGHFYATITSLQQSGVKVNVHDTICRQVSNRERELREFVSNYDAIVFVSGTKSSNGKALYHVCRDKNPKSYFVSAPDQVRKSWFTENNTVGICGATSTPMWLMEEVKRKLETF